MLTTTIIIEYGLFELRENNYLICTILALAVNTRNGKLAEQF